MNRAPEAGAAVLARVHGVFDERLDASSRAPIAVGFSGGGDSLALLLAARAWAALAGRPVLALTVDHGLQPASADWTRAAGRIAGEIGCAFQALAWLGPKPTAGLAAAARRARHALLADAARAAGASVLLLGHTKDDLIEAELMRQEGSSVGSPRAWAPSPAWPEGRGVFLLRPLLALRRAELRALVGPSGLGWIEDPSNDDQRFARARARRRASFDDAEPPCAPPSEPPAAIADAAGVVRLSRSELLAASAGDQRRLIAMASVCAGGGEQLPRGRSLGLILERVRLGAPFAATLAGARIVAGEEILIGRDAGRLLASPGAVRALEPGAVEIWDGRYELAASEPGWSVRPLRGLAARLAADARRALAAIPPFARGGLPALTRGQEEPVICPILARTFHLRVRMLVDARLAGACGRIARERQLVSGSHGEERLGALS